MCGRRCEIALLSGILSTIETIGVRKRDSCYIPRDIPANFDERICPRLREQASPLLRLPTDKISDRPTLVYKSMTGDFLRLGRQRLSLQNRRRLLKTSIEAIADTHSRDVVHLGVTLPPLIQSRANAPADIKPDNIMVDCKHGDQRTIVEDMYNSPTWKGPHTYFTASASKACWQEMIIGGVRRRTSRVNSASRLTCSHLASSSVS